MTISHYLSDNLTRTAANALLEVFSTQLKLSLEESSLPIDSNALLHSSVSIIGERLEGSVLLQFSEVFAARATELMIGGECEEDDIKDVTGELCIMIAGRVKVGLSAAGFTGTLATPTVTVGAFIKLRQVAGSEFCETSWSCEGHGINLQIIARILPS